MSADSKLYTRMANYSGISTLVGTRIYPLILPQNVTFPAVVYQRISGTAQNGTTSIREARYQLSCWSATFSGTKALADQVRGAMEEWSSGGTGTLVRMCRVVNELDDYEPDEKVYRTIIDVILHIDE